MRQPRALLTVAGTDPSGGAGLQVDLQVFRDFGFHGTSVATAILWQNTVGVRGFQALEARHVEAQLDVLLEDVPVAGVKVGMLAAPSTARVVAGVLEDRLDSAPAILDPVLAGGGEGTRLAESDLVGALRETMLDRVSLITPNVPEAEALLDRPIEACDDMERAAEDLVQLGADAALVKAGHLSEDGASETIRDVLAVDGASAEWLEPLPRVDADVRGTGCQLSSAAAARLARGDSIRDAVETARRYLNDLITDASVEIGSGRPVVVRTETDAGPREEP